MSTARLSDIITKVRKLTGSGNNLQLTDEVIIDHINSFYLYDFPAQFRSLQLKNTFTINTIANVGTYPFDFEHYTTLEAPALINKNIVPFYQNYWAFCALGSGWQQNQRIGTGNGTQGPYPNFTLQNAPIVRSVNNNPIADTQTPGTFPFAPASYPPVFREPNPARMQNILITANTATGTENVTDDGAGVLIGAIGVSGGIDYSTGIITGLTFANPIPAGIPINISYNPSNPSVPQAILFWQNNITLSPVPNGGYLVEIVAYRRPSQILLGTADPSIPNTAGLPELLEWWETIAAGTAKKIFEDRMDMDGVAMMDKMLYERYALNETRTYAQLGKQRIGTIFSGQLDGYDGGFLNFTSGNR